MYLSFRTDVTPICTPILFDLTLICIHDDVIKWKHFPHYWIFAWRIRRSPVNSPYKGQWRRALMFLWSVPWINGRVNNPEAGDLRCHHAHYDIIVMCVSDNGRSTVLSVKVRSFKSETCNNHFEHDQNGLITCNHVTVWYSNCQPPSGPKGLITEQSHYI